MFLDGSCMTWFELGGKCGSEHIPYLHASRAGSLHKSRILKSRFFCCHPGLLQETEEALTPLLPGGFSTEEPDDFGDLLILEEDFIGMLTPFMLHASGSSDVLVSGISDLPAFQRDFPVSLS